MTLGKKRVPLIDVDNLMRGNLVYFNSHGPDNTWKVDVIGPKYLIISNPFGFDPKKTYSKPIKMIRAIPLIKEVQLDALGLEKHPSGRYILPMAVGSTLVCKDDICTRFKHLHILQNYITLITHNPVDIHQYYQIMKQENKTDAR